MFFLNNVGLFLGAREKVHNEFKSRIFPIKIVDEILTPESDTAPEAESEVAAPKETENISNLKLHQ